ncbi:GTPB2-like protein [Mya arenaria]|uniref:GTPB2-like protein n=1 Tax=Mya arenaria TaxID=6604 RepID=A0ABY7FBN5_MYAAR|nr:GTPB2-like protein [Mya arenaria]
METEHTPLEPRDTERLPENLPPEVEEGNVEYKLKLVNPSAERLEHLVTQMKWRLEEGQGEAIYEIGVEDNGLLVGLMETELQASVASLEHMAERLGATLTVLRERCIDDENGEEQRRALEILVRKVPDDQKFIDLRLTVLGNVDSGKSTLLGVLTHGELDNGRGKARQNLFRHLHEIQTGRTSCISHEILGFNNKGEVVNYSESRSVEEICEASSKLITLIDLAGHHKYLKTTIFGLTCYSPDFSMLVVSANTGMAGTTKEHLGFALALKVPIFVVVTKVDMCRKFFIEKTVSQLEKILKSPGCKKIPVRIANEDDAITAAQNFDTDNSHLLHIICEWCKPPAALQIPESDPTSEQGQRQAGTAAHRIPVREGDQLMLGPYEDGQFQSVKVKTVHRHRLPCRLIQAGQASTVALHDVEREHLRKGMVLVSSELVGACMEFEADVYLLYHDTRVCPGFRTTVHVGNVCQSVQIMEIKDKTAIKTNQKAQVIFKFMKQPEYIRVGSRLLFRQGTAKGVGEVIKIYPYTEVPTR